MPRSKNARRLPRDPARLAADDSANQIRNELQKTMLLLEHRHILEEQRASLLENYQELLDRGNRSMARLKEMTAKKSNNSGRKAS